MSTYTILAIDDSKKILDIIKYFLENEGYAVKAVGDPFDGIQVAQQGGIDLILLDIMMPGMDGYTVFDNLKKDPRTREVLRVGNRVAPFLARRDLFSYAVVDAYDVK